MRDTAVDVEQIRLAAIRRMTPTERLRQAFEWSESMRRLTLEGLRGRHPELSDRALVELMVGVRFEPHPPAQ
jgi:hypothetical protein